MEQLELGPYEEAIDRVVDGLAERTGAPRELLADLAGTSEATIRSCDPPAHRVRTPPARRGPRKRRTWETDAMEDEALARFLDPDS